MKILVIKPLAEDQGFQTALLTAKQRAKVTFANWLKATSGQTVDPDTVFDTQVKRIHEYKRQLLNALRIIIFHNSLRANPAMEMVPRNFLRPKSGTGVRLAKLIIKFINNVASVIDADPDVKGRMKILFLPRVQRFARRTVYTRLRCVESDFDRGLRSERNE
jgi:glycogen phosphorylase